MSCALFKHLCESNEDGVFDSKAVEKLLHEDALTAKICCCFCWTRWIKRLQMCALIESPVNASSIGASVMECIETGCVSRRGLAKGAKPKAPPTCPRQKRDSRSPQKKLSLHHVDSCFLCHTLVQLFILSIFIFSGCNLLLHPTS